MSLSPGTRLGAYEIVSAVGAGGMGEVYRARDTKLGREVAIKVLLPLFANDAERLARFDREAKLLAALNHPNIAHIYDLYDGTTVGGPVLVMEFVEGPTLADRIANGPLPISELLQIARQIIDALCAAHEHGTVHRDLKPANIKIRDDGTVKVLDFGLAKPLEAVTANSSLSQSPTITTPAITHAGIILGTAAYMSPEQIKGRGLDKRTDIWAFGCVLFEMLTGAPPFAADDVPDTLAAILSKDPNWGVLPLTTPPQLLKLLRRCLEKDRSRRLADISDARFELEETAPFANPRVLELKPTPRRSERAQIACRHVMVLHVSATGFTTRTEP